MTVATVDLRLPRLRRCSIATVGGTPASRSTFGPRQHLHELARVGRQAVEVAALALGVDDVERQRRLARAAQAGDDDELVARQVEAEVAQVVLLGADDAHQRRRRWSRARRRLGATSGALARRSGPRAPAAQVAAGVRRRRRGDVLRRALGDDAPAAGAALGAEVDDPVGRLDDLHVVLDHHHRVAALDQRCSAASSVSTSAKCSPIVGSSNRKSVCDLVVAAHRRGELQALRLAARQRGQRLAEAQVAEADVEQRLQARGSPRTLAEEAHRVLGGQVEHVADRLARCTVTSSTSARKRAPLHAGQVT